MSEQEHAPATTSEEMEEQEESHGQQLTNCELAQGMSTADWNGIDIMKSLCMNCGEEGETRMMLHKIPYFRELIIASFYCEACGERNNEVTFGGEIQPQGCVYELKVTKAEDMDRQLIKSDSAIIRIPELDLEIPAMTQRGAISTIEGVLKKAAEDLGMYQAERMQQMPEAGIKVAQIIGQLTMMSNRFPSSLPFHMVVDDCAGNSFVENPLAPSTDPNLRIRYYNRSAEQDTSLGLQPEAETGVFKDDAQSNFQALMGKNSGGFGQLKGAGATAAPTTTTVAADATTTDAGMDTAVDKEKGEEISAQEQTHEAAVAQPEEAEAAEEDDSGVVCIPTCCPHCGVEGDTRSALTSIPHFKEVLIMAFNCKDCGFRTNEVKGGGGVPTYGTEVTLRVSCAADLSRDLLKSDTAMVAIPDLDLELAHGSLGGMFTSVEGLLQKIVQKLLESNPFAVGDSSVNNHSLDHSARDRFGDFIDRLKQFAKGEVFPFSVQLRDPLGNSFISSQLGSSTPPEMDQALTMVDFERSFEEVRLFVRVFVHLLFVRLFG
jgi:zinc finger protein